MGKFKIKYLNWSNQEVEKEVNGNNESEALMNFYGTSDYLWCQRKLSLEKIPEEEPKPAKGKKAKKGGK